MTPTNPRFAIDADLVAGRKLAAADLRLLIVSLLAQGPHHGYEIMAAIQDRSLGYYRPSPGVLYPALIHIKEAGLASVESIATRKRYRMTAAAQPFVEERRERLAIVWDRLERNGRKLARIAAEPATSEAVLRARAALDRALRNRARANPHEQLRIAQILHRATADIVATDLPGAG